MKQRPTLLPLTLCVSLGLHGCLFFMLSFQRPDNQRAPKQINSAKTVSLVNLALIEPPPEKPAPTPPPPPAIPETPDAEPESPPETFISLETPPESAGTPASQPSPTEEPDTNAAQTYLKNNYEHIQRHIRSKLIYPLEARSSGIQGVAELSFVIHTDGQVSNVTITVSSGSETLDTSAVEAIYSAAPFRPPPAEARLVIPVAFRLR
jgi:protein TonB